MATKIDPKAMVSPKAVLGENVTVAPYAVIGDNVKIGSGCIIDSFAQVLGFTEIGKNCHIYSYAVLGNTPQDLKYKGDKSYLFVGDNNQIREFVTMHPGTEENSKTIVGNSNLFMVYSHIAHDCRVGNDNVFANCATLAGYVDIENKVVIGGLVAVHQFCRIGSHAIIGGCSKVVQDIPPYSMSDGHPAVVHGLNLVGLRRAGFSNETITTLKKAFKTLFFDNHPFDKAKELIKKDFPASAEINYL
ncbi:MAG: acyl-ACP--UDP-N-acetylglucosamine O-acyltransferase, partial [Candidatus Omnitrophica bacterium]|nr:acyl-ACP--UDP-N-acetylglucosamine O-acyltransferase [Candidatus Omnitrophota bacterium]